MTGASSQRILIVATGFSELTLRFAAALARHARVMVIVNADNLQRECGDVFTFQTPGLQIVPIDMSMPVKTFSSLLLRLIAFRPHLVQIEETNSKWIKRIVLLCKRFAPVVLRVHDTKPHSGADSLVGSQVLKDHQRIRQSVDAVIVHGAYCEAEFSSLYPTPVICSTHGEILVPSTAAQKNFIKGSVLMFGRMEAYKGLDVLLDAFRIIRKQSVPLSLTLAGRGPEITRLKSEFEALSNVTIIDRYVGPEEVVDLFQLSEFCVAPYKDATQSGVVAAAIANQRIPICSRVGGMPDVVSDGVNGRLVTPSDSMALARVLIELAEDSAQCDRLRQGVIHTKTIDLNWDRISDRLWPQILPLMRK